MGATLDVRAQATAAAEDGSTVSDSNDPPPITGLSGTLDTGTVSANARSSVFAGEPAIGNGVRQRRDDHQRRFGGANFAGATGRYSFSSDAESVYNGDGFARYGSGTATVEAFAIRFALDAPTDYTLAVRHDRRPAGGGAL